MKQKYSILLGENENELIIKESGELDKGIFSIVFEEKYNRETIKAACEKDKATLISTFRTSGFYPVNACAELIADGIRDFFKSDCIETKEISFNDVSMLKDVFIENLLDEVDANPVELDKLLEDETSIEDDSILEDDEINPIASSPSSIKIADDDGIQADDDI
ncbi:MAG: hypothetical protein C0403_08840 [Desulfobacterium sp.]|nr:hypothetical protein [Desulfobacterium sp.]